MEKLLADQLGTHALRQLPSFVYVNGEDTFTDSQSAFSSLEIALQELAALASTAEGCNIFDDLADRSESIERQASFTYRIQLI